MCHSNSSVEFVLISFILVYKRDLWLMEMCFVLTFFTTGPNPFSHKTICLYPRASNYYLQNEDCHFPQVDNRQAEMTQGMALL